MTEIVKTKTEIWKIREIAHNAFLYTEGFRKIHSGCNYKIKSCFKCNREFQDGEHLDLIFFEKRPNRFVCGNCGSLLSEVSVNEP